ncbi:glycosyltransferase family A protein [Flavobacterium sp.]|uniref:glycosyltransferase family A protein n=1 Tax=Flavobacterium sp. TaxID=239 RepID=UPI002FDD27FA
MRVGTNPKIGQSLPLSDYFHQVIVPVYIPDNEGYFKDSFEVFKISLASLLKTCHAKTYIAVVNNGSCSEVVSYLHDLYQKGSIHELLHTPNIGKVNAVNKALMGSSFPWVTVADADVLFLNGWQQAVYTVFNAFPKAGAVCTTPNSRAFKRLTENIFFDCFFSRSLRFTVVKNSQAMVRFLDSIGNPMELRPIHLQKYLTVNHDQVSAVVGAGHYVCTYKRKALPECGFGNVNTLLGKKVMDAIDTAIVRKGYWRLSTAENYTYHMGNVAEAWMTEELNRLQQERQEVPAPQEVVIRFSPLLNGFKMNVFGKILFSRQLFWKNFLRFKGLKKEEAKYY